MPVELDWLPAFQIQPRGVVSSRLEQLYPRQRRAQPNLERPPVPRLTQCRAHTLRGMPQEGDSRHTRQDTALP